MRILLTVFRLGMVVAVCVAELPAQGRGQPAAADQDSRQKLAGYLDAIAESQLASRKQAIAQIRTAPKRTAARRWSARRCSG